ncbi:MAG: hypothetical protein ACLGPL_09895 [Acidobacteriota bacterium]
MTTGRENVCEEIRLNPVECEEVDDTSRRVFCKHYDTCLDYAVEKGWKGFHCKECTAYAAVVMDRDAWKADEIACNALICQIFWPERMKYVRKGGYRARATC